MRDAAAVNRGESAMRSGAVDGAREGDGQVADPSLWLHERGPALSAGNLRGLVRDLGALVEHRAEQEERITTERRTGQGRLSAELAARRAELERSRDEKLADIERRRAAGLAAIEAERQAALDEIGRQTEQARHHMVERFDEPFRKEAGKLREAVWVAETMYEANEHKPAETYEKELVKFKEKARRIEGIRAEADALVVSYRQRALLNRPAPGGEGSPPGGDASPALDRAIELAEGELDRLGRLRTPRLFQEGLPYVLVPVAMAAPVLAAWWWMGFQPSDWLWVVAGASFVVVVLGTLLLYRAGRASTWRVYSSLRGRLGAAESALEGARQHAATVRAEQEQALRDARDAEIEQAKRQYDPKMQRIRDERAAFAAQIDGKRTEALNATEQRRQERTAELTTALDGEAEATRLIAAAGISTAEEEHGRASSTLGSRCDGAWGVLVREWNEGMARLGEMLQGVRAEEEALFPAWGAGAWDEREAPTMPPPAVRFGRMTVDVGKLEGGLAESAEFAAVPDGGRKAGVLELPAVLDFPGAGSLLIESGPEGRSAAISMMQALMLRILTTFPPGKVRFTIVDPVGLGESFAGFMHLADYDEQMVGSRIWTEARHIEQRLADLTEHMENVIQKYLRNEFSTIAEYNERAGEVAEPYRFLVIADFPTNFTDAAAKRLLSIISSGARCGVYVILLTDPAARLPAGIRRAELNQLPNRLVRRGGKQTGDFVWKDPDFERFELTVENAPPEEFLTAELRRVGRLSKEGSRVEVPFRMVAPEPGQEWTADCTQELVVPVGRAGATKLQNLSLGRGTLQHVLVAGKTGSGKSTLLHVLITNLSLWYSPEQVDFYLVDFKKGVEFKTYAMHHLPHARAIAIESDREFGLSVLQEVDAELKRRGDLFRSLGVNDLAAFRRARPDERMPRTLLVIDEFQELFIEDDKVAQESALLLDRLVRQGRAFGIHILLGSQTLGGAYSLARTTMGQMGVRIALQCSEADSYLILSEDNAAARLLSRPGEGIYNDASGLIEGNNPFQVAWLPDSTREANLNRVSARAAGLASPLRTVVFEGNAPARLEENPQLSAARATEPPAGAGPGGALRAWIGEPVAIREATHVDFARQTASNLLIVGQRREEVTAMVAAAITSIAAQTRAPGDDGEPGGAEFVLIDGERDAAAGGAWDRLRGLASEVQRADPAMLLDVLGRLKVRVSERQAGIAPGATPPSPVFLFLVGLQHLREVRRSDDFAFSTGDGDDVKADRLLTELLTDGPAFGVHTIVWSDTLQNLNRALDRQAVKQFGNRVLFQMSASDSIELIDSPRASTLGLHRALLWREDEAEAEKFRPYA